MNKNNVRKAFGVVLFMGSVLMFLADISVVGACMLGALGIGAVIHID
jgi:hypothetical protein